jgi:hypothetical protein
VTLHDKLIHAATEYDRKESTKRGYNRYALAQYFQAIQSVDECIANGGNPREVIIGHFTGRLQDRMLKAAGLEKGTDAECRGDGQWTRKTDY